MRSLAFVFVLLAVALHGAATPRPVVDLVLTNAHVVTLNDQREQFVPGCVVIRGSTLVAVGPAALAEGYTAHRTIAVGGDIVMPGMNGEVAIVSERRENVLAIPNTALLRS